MIITVMKRRILLQAYLKVSFEIYWSSPRETFFRPKLKFAR